MSHKACVLFLWVATVAPCAMAADGTINFSGELRAQTCTITVNGAVSPAAALVTLPAVSVSGLAAAGQVAGRTNFNIELTQCSGSATTAEAFFESAGSVDTVSGNLKNLTGTAKLVQLQLVDATNGQVIRPGIAIIPTSRATIGTTGNATLPYSVQYFATGTTTAGTVASSVTYSINYQ